MKNILSIAILFIASVSFSQVLTTHNDEVIEDGYAFDANTLSEDLGIYVLNNTNENIFTQIIVESIENNSNGDNLQLCYGGLCFAEITEGTAYPTSGPLVISPGRNNGDYDHFVNSYEGDNPNEPVKYKFIFVLTDSNGNVIDGSEIHFSYTYGAMDIESLQLNQPKKLLYNSIATQHLSLNNEVSGEVVIYNMAGNVVLSSKVSEKEVLGVQRLSPGNYIVQFNDGNGIVKSQKFIKK